jgi:hypothetical protein
VDLGFRQFDYVQQALELNREVATRWAELLTSLSGSVRGSRPRSSAASSPTRWVLLPTWSTARRRQKVEEVANEQAVRAEEAAQEQEREIKRAERVAAKQAREAARKPYEG